MSNAESSFWVRWHTDYDNPASEITQRLSVVQRRVRQAIDLTGSRPIRLISVCAGQGRDVIGSLDGHARATDARALLVESDEHNVKSALDGIAEAGLRGVEVKQGD